MVLEGRQDLAKLLSPDKKDALGLSSGARILVRLRVLLWVACQAWGQLLQESGHPLPLDILSSAKHETTDPVGLLASWSHRPHCPSQL